MSFKHTSIILALKMIPLDSQYLNLFLVVILKISLPPNPLNNSSIFRGHFSSTTDNDQEPLP